MSAVVPRRTKAVVRGSTPLSLFGQDDEGYWIARDVDGLRGGLFVSREAAVTYAHDEAPDAQIVEQPKGRVSLDLKSARAA